MKLSWATTLLFLCSTGVTALPTESQTDLIARHAEPAEPAFVDLEKRRGGGGGGGGRGGGSSGGGSGGRSSGSRGSSSGSGGGGSSGGSSSSSNNRGGTSNRGSGVAPAYGGGRYDTTHGYGTGFTSYPHYPVSRPATYSTKTDGQTRYYAGGAAAPYSAGRRSPLGITPFLLPAAAVAFLLPAAWAYGAYAYPYHHNYHYYNETNHQNSSMPVVCVCQEYQECGCDDNNNSTYYESLFNGTEPHNTSDVRVVNVNGTEKIYINGTLANGTTAENTSTSAASSVLHISGFWFPVAVVSMMVWGL
ncbi:hypothetical protein N7492_003992 [Penicillium capsulatum]|uniref:DUF7732 domain-containing protein n=1 Tax=Penicillium capsulatum TaxID=69766 RepID=A0A9W9IMZ5_9EURO|nr:hypothetical protein N7492_003992 [Penicillium capsulatum]KAJ6121433.1 hypothetical protein N7512_003898 [Penicillium capsulatum]